MQKMNKAMIKILRDGHDALLAHMESVFQLERLMWSMFDPTDEYFEECLQWTEEIRTLTYKLEGKLLERYE